jgi:thiol:disulfide interchange protein DsbD
MVNSAITAMQLFGVGLSLGFGGQCFFVCAPLILPFAAGVGDNWKAALKDTALLISGRLAAYILLGGLAGISGAYIDRMAGHASVVYLKFLVGTAIVMLGLAVALGANPGMNLCERLRNSPAVRLGLFAAGFVVGILPCLPLVSVMFEITLISRSFLQGAVYAAFFGLGTALATIILIGPLASLLGHFTRKAIKSAGILIVFRIACGLLIGAYGFYLLKGASF